MRRLRGLEGHMGIYKIIDTSYEELEENVKIIEPTAFINIDGEYYGAETIDDDGPAIIFDDTIYCQVILGNGDKILLPERNVYKQFCYRSPK